MYSLTKVLLCIFSSAVNDSKHILLIFVNRRVFSKMSSSKPLNKVFILDYISISLGLGMIGVCVLITYILFYHKCLHII